MSGFGGMCSGVRGHDIVAFTEATVQGVQGHTA